MKGKSREINAKQMQGQQKISIKEEDNIKNNQIIQRCSDLFIQKSIRFPSINYQKQIKHHLFIDFKMTKLQTADGNIQLLKKIAQQIYKKQQQQLAKKKKSNSEAQAQNNSKVQTQNRQNQRIDRQCFYCSCKFKVSQLDKHLLQCPAKKQHLFINPLSANNNANRPPVVVNASNNSSNDNSQVSFFFNNQNNHTQSSNNRNPQNNNNNINLQPNFHLQFQQFQQFQAALNALNPANFNITGLINPRESDQNDQNDQNEQNEDSESQSSVSQSQNEEQSSIPGEQNEDYIQNEQVFQIQQNIEERIVQGYSLKKLKQLKQQIYRPKENNVDLQCNICSQPIIANEMMLPLKCQHFYHHDCAKLWLQINKSCPTCNQRIKKNDIFK